MSGTCRIDIDDARRILDALRVAVPVDPSTETFSRHRLGDKVALGKVTTQLSDRCILLIRLDTLGHNVQIQRLAERNNGLHNPGVRFRIIELGDEGLVDLEGFDRQLGKINNL